jgi:DNA-directed RNA polymerase sigma subunit (sigma70/sigma32)
LIRIPEYLFLLRQRFRRMMGQLDRPSMIGIGSIAMEQSSIEQIAEKMGIPPSKLRSPRLLMIERDHHSEPDRDGESRALTEAMDSCRRPEEEAVDHERRGLINAALRQLNPVEAWVIRERYGLHTLMLDDLILAESSPRTVRRVTKERVPDSPTDRFETSRSQIRRTYTDLKCDCGLSCHRLRQIERTALDKLRRLLAPWFDQDR